MRRASRSVTLSSNKTGLRRRQNDSRNFGIAGKNMCSIRRRRWRTLPTLRYPPWSETKLLTANSEKDLITVCMIPPRIQSQKETQVKSAQHPKAPTSTGHSKSRCSGNQDEIHIRACSHCRECLWHVRIT